MEHDICPEFRGVQCDVSPCFGHKGDANPGVVVVVDFEDQEEDEGEDPQEGRVELA